MSNILKFPKSSPHAGRVMTQQQAIQLYSALMNLYTSVNVGAGSNRDLTRFLINNPAGLTQADTLTAASLISKNADMLDQMKGAIGMMMRFLMEQSSISMADVIYQDQSHVPDDQPPAA